MAAFAARKQGRNGKNGALRGSMSHYDGVDWIAMCLTFSAIYLLGNKSRIGFVVMMLGNLLWCIIGLQAEAMPWSLPIWVFFP
jgi:hypothetical protein